MRTIPHPDTAQARYRTRYQNPQWLTFHLSEVSAGVYAEGTYETETYQKSSTTVSHENLFVGPFLSLSADGSVYHPRLLRYFINTAGSYGWNEDRVVSGGTTTSRREWEYLGRLSASISLLEEKPYHGSAYVDYDHSYRDNDFFNRVTVESLRYGARGMWQVGNFTFNADYLHRNETSSSPYWGTETTSTTTTINGKPVTTVTTNQVRLTQKTVSDEDTATFSGRHQRESGGTAFNYNLNHYTRSEGSSVGTGTDQSFSLSDSERFGARARNHYDTGNYRSDYYAGSVSLSHQLYESLSSSISLRGSDYETSDSSNVGYTRRFGGSWAENSTKKIGLNSRLRLKHALSVEHTDQETVGTIKNEQHSFTENNPEPNSFVLNQQYVISSSIVVRDSGKTQQYISGIDYEVIAFGNQTEIHRLSGSAMPNSVVVDYQCTPTPPGSYSTFTEAAEIRLELWKNLLGLYARANLSLNDAPAALMIQEVTAYKFGTEATYKAAHGGAEYEIYDSSESHYRAARLFESVAWHPSQASTLSLDATETWLDYVDSHRHEEDYRFVTRYHDVLTPHLSVGVDTGVSFRRGNGSDQLLAAFRPAIKYVIGKTTIDVGYDYEYDLYLRSQESQTHRFSLRWKR